MRGSRPSASSRVALLEGQFVLHYQPKIAVGTGETFGAEALVRWQHPTRGLLHPDAFLEIVEQSGSIGRLTQIVLELAVRQLSVWHAAGVPISVAVNLSASDLLDAELPERIMSLLVRAFRAGRRTRARDHRERPDDRSGPGL